jgi:Fe-S-cluster containining protein
VNKREIKRISRYLNMDSDSFLRDYCQWSGGRPLIRSSESGYCVFWDKVCTIHPVKPRMCAIWPFIESILVDPANWDVIHSMCPGVSENVTSEDLAECVRQVLSEYAKDCHD